VFLAPARVPIGGDARETRGRSPDEYPQREEDGARPTEPMLVAPWLYYSVAALVILVGLVLPMLAVAWSLWSIAHDIWHL
jgi:hypothetical protein